MAARPWQIEYYRGLQVIDFVCDLLNIYCHSSISPLIDFASQLVYRFFYCRGGRRDSELVDLFQRIHRF